MNILLLGGGGREHAFAWKMAQSPLCEQLFIAPGNAGTAQCGENVAMSPNDFEAVKRFVLDKNVGLVVVGPEEPLVLGIVDAFRNDPAVSNIPIVGPAKEGALLEGSKAFAKTFMNEFGIPTAAYREFRLANLEEGLTWLETQKPPFVLKADGLAAGKGVVILDNLAEAQEELRAMLSGKFGKASECVVVEQFLSGIEFSVFAATDGKTYKILPEAKDYKRIGEGDTGPNTGGMGAVSPVPFANEALMKKVEERIIQPTINGIISKNIDYKGFVFFGLIVVEGEPFVIEYNCRMGDPETEAVFPRIQSDLVELLLATAQGQLSTYNLVVDPRAAVAVMLVSGGYPGDYAKGKEVLRLDNADSSIVFHAGTTLAPDGRILTSGGRVIAVTSYGNDFREALQISNSNAAIIGFEGKGYRRDIGLDLMGL